MSLITEEFFLNATPDKTQVQRIKDIRAASVWFVRTLNQHVVDSPEKTLALRSLKDAQARAIEAILFRDEQHPLELDRSPLDLIGVPE